MQYNKEFIALSLEFKFDDLEWHAFCGQPIVYDGELYVVRREIKPGTHEYLRWIKGIRVV